MTSSSKSILFFVLKNNFLFYKYISKRSQGDAGRSRWHDNQTRNRNFNWTTNTRNYPRDKGKEDLWHFKDATSIFISNMPSPVEIGALKDKLKPIGTLVDLYIVSRKDKHGHRFGFARYNRVKDINNLIENLNKLEIQGRRLFAKIAKFDRKATQEVDLREVINVNKERREIGMAKSYAEVTRGDKQHQ